MHETQIPVHSQHLLHFDNRRFAKFYKNWHETGCAKEKSFPSMHIINSVNFLILGIIMRLAPVVAPASFASDATNVVATATPARGLLFIVLGYIFGAMGVWFLLRETISRVVPAMTRVIQGIRARRETRALALAREMHAQSQTLMWLTNMRARILESDMKQAAEYQTRMGTRDPWASPGAFDPR